MISGKIREDLTLHTILNKISEYDIYRHYIGHDFKLGEPFSSPLHDDRNPSFSIIATSSGRLHFTDFAEKHQRGKIIDFLRNFYPGKDYNEILQEIDREFNLGIQGKPAMVPFQRNESPYSSPANKSHEEKLFQVVPRNFNFDELRYWNDYHQDIADLKEWKVFVPKRLYIDKKAVPLPKNELVFAYLYDEKYWKIYKPHARNKKEKWLSNVPQQLLIGLNKLQPGLPVLCTKAHKDLMVIKKVFNNACSTQSEGTNVFSEEHLYMLKSGFPDIYINFDPDDAGRHAMYYYMKAHRFKHLKVPCDLYANGLKDLAKVGKELGLRSVEEIIKRKINYHENLCHQTQRNGPVHQDR